MGSLRRLLHGKIQVLLVQPSNPPMNNTTMDRRVVYYDHEVWFVRPKLVSKLVLPGRPIYDVVFDRQRDVEWKAFVTDWVVGTHPVATRWHTLGRHYRAIAALLDAREGLPLALADYLGERPYKTRVTGRGLRIDNHG